MISNNFFKPNTMDKIDYDSCDMQFRIAVNTGLQSLLSRIKLNQYLIHDPYKRYCYGINDGEKFFRLNNRLCRLFKAENADEFKWLYFGKDFPKSNLFVFDWERDDEASILDRAKECLLEPIEKGF